MFQKWLYRPIVLHPHTKVGAFAVMLHLIDNSDRMPTEDELMTAIKAEVRKYRFLGISRLTKPEG